MSLEVMTLNQIPMINTLRKIPFAAWMVVATCMSLALNLVVLARSGPLNVWGDAHFYHNGANLIADGKGWIEPLSYLRDGIVYQAADHPPAHLAYLAIFSLVGLTSVGAHQFATILVSVATIPFFGLVGRRLGGHTVGVLAALIASVHAGLWGWNKMIHSEPSAILGVVLLLLSAFRYSDRARAGVSTWRDLVLLGVTAGFATQTRAELALTGVLLILIVVVQREWRAMARNVSVAALAFALTLAPWVSFNLSRFDSPVFLSTGFEITWASSNCPDTYEGNFKAYWSIACTVDYMKRAEENRPGADRATRMREVGRLGTEFVKNHKAEFAKLTVLRVGRVLGLYRVQQQMKLDVYPEGRGTNVVRLAWWSYFALLPFTFAGMFFLRRDKRRLLMLTSTIGVALLVCAITFGNTRYRVTAEPALVLLAAFGLVKVAARARERLLRRSQHA